MALFYKLVTFVQRKPEESLIITFLFLFFLLPLRCPNSFSYDYVPYSELDDDLLYCQMKDHRKSVKPFCPEIPKYKEVHMRVDREVNQTQLENLATELNINEGGKWRPSTCKSHFHVAIIIPNRGRDSQLSVLLNHLHRFLQKQLIDYQIFVVEQTDEHNFNKGILFNAAYLEAIKIRDFCCLILNDVDLLPENLLNLFVSISKNQFAKVNGFSNEFWGWGGEDDDFMNRIKEKGLQIVRWEPSISKYTMLFHPKETKNPIRKQLLYEGVARQDDDGLNQVKYKLVDKKFYPLYTWFYVNVKPEEDSNTSTL